jgi:hypothetical protein
MKNVWDRIKAVFAPKASAKESHLPSVTEPAREPFRSVPIPVSKAYKRAHRARQREYARGWFTQEHHYPILPAHRLWKLRASCSIFNLTVLSKGANEKLTESQRFAWINFRRMRQEIMR